MGALKNRIRRLSWPNVKIRRQMHGIYFVAMLLPLLIVGVLLIQNADRLLNEHYTALLEADNLRVKTVLSEIGTTVYDISDELGYDSALKRILVREYADSSEFISEVNRYDRLDTLVYDAQELGGIYIYTDNPTVKNYKQFRRVGEKEIWTDWFQAAVNQPGSFWASIEDENTYGSEKSNLCLVRRVALPDSNYRAVMVIQVSDAYIRSRVASGSIIDAVSLAGQGIVYSTKNNWYGQAQPVEIDESDDYFRYSGTAQVDDQRYFVTVSTTTLHRTSSKLYVCTLDNSGFDDIRQILFTWVLMLLFAVVVPGVIVAVFAKHFAGRVNLLRAEMHKARNQDYDIISDFSGNDELTEAFEDLKQMVQAIKEKDARMYASELKSQELRNRQQIMEYKMLAGQINPHYLYNALETIRMKALAMGSREVADSIKILGKTLHYVLENTGTAYTTLKKELEHVKNYLAIQKLRFGERIDYSVSVHPELDTGQITMLPLLLQPVAENAVVHGLESVSGPGQITIEAGLTQSGDLQLTVTDNGSGMTREELEKLRAMLDTPERDPLSGIALYNIHQRIRLSCGEGYGIRLESVQGAGTRVTLTLPKRVELGKKWENSYKAVSKL